MSIFGSIMSKVFGSKAADAAPVGIADAPAAAAAAAASADVDVTSILDGMPGADGLNWRTSIVDLMKLLGLDSSLDHRKELADELGFDGDKGDSASMNIWLHKQVITQFAAAGGKVPDELKA